MRKKKSGQTISNEVLCAEYDAFNESADNVISRFVSSGDGYLGAEYSDGEIVIWNFDGTVLSEKSADGK